GGAGTGGTTGTPSCIEGEPVSVDVRAWGATFTGVYLNAGDSVQISATGMWLGKSGETGPDGSGSGPEDCPAGALVARIAKFHQRTCIGADGSFTAERPGYVWLYQSDGGDAVQSSGMVQATLSGGHCSTLPREGMHPVGATLTAEQRAEYAAVCGREGIEVYFEAEKPDDPIVQRYVGEYMGGDALAWLENMNVEACATFYGSAEAYTAAFGSGGRSLAHYIHDGTLWDAVERPFFNFVLQNPMAELIVSQPDYGPMGGIPVSINHEAGHFIAPDGGEGTLPKWLGETYAELAPSNRGFADSFYHSIDNPESPRFGGEWMWCDGTFGGPTFVSWIDTQHPGFIHALTDAALELGGDGTWPGSQVLFQELTGVTFDELWQGYADAYGISGERTVADCLDPPE
ncbi:MAG TPA: hypothetical protein VM686_30770, partial [Polyangiaceae bacterium]|nr:hypothetical protein [Polyangiaceae bacterium]